MKEKHMLTSEEFYKNAKPYKFPENVITDEMLYPDRFPKPKKFLPCPVCGSRDIKESIKHNDICGPGGRSWVEYEYCENCGVHLCPDRKKFKKVKQ